MQDQNVSTEGEQLAIAGPSSQQQVLVEPIVQLEVDQAAHQSLVNSPVHSTTLSAHELASKTQAQLIELLMAMQKKK